MPQREKLHLPEDLEDQEELSGTIQMKSMEFTQRR
jgi:hypothetical protein